MKIEGILRIGVENLGNKSSSILQGCSNLIEQCLVVEKGVKLF